MHKHAGFGHSNEGRHSDASLQATRRILLGPIGAVLMVAMVFLLGMLAADANARGLVVWGIVTTLAFAAVVLIARSGS